MSCCKKPDTYQLKLPKIQKPQEKTTDKNGGQKIVAYPTIPFVLVAKAA
jgi:hypothetical protein